MTDSEAPPQISVVVPAYNAAKTLAACLDSLHHQSLSPSLYEIIVVDDGSTDLTSQIAQQRGVCLIQQPRGRTAAARNAGIRAARGSIICFTDADCVPAPDWLEQLTAPFADPQIAGCKGIYATHQKEPTARFVQLEYEDKYDLLRQQEQIDFIDTYCAAYRRDILLANDGFDERFPYLEDQELSFRLAARGYKLIFQPQAKVYHRHAYTVAGYFRKKFVIGFWKAQVVRRFPERGVKDSHTPQVMKVQIGLMALILGLLLALFFSRWATVPLVGSAGIFLLTTLPFMQKARHKDPPIALLSPFFLTLRALGLGIGYGWGLLRPQPTGQTSTISGNAYLAKRTLDLIGGFVGLLLLLLFTPFIALAIKLTSPGPVFFKQERIGQGGKPFILYKFRSMTVDAETELAQLIDLNKLKEPAFKLANDPRITPIGKLLRRWSLDELPQFWNILKGEMSLIGPRPEETRIVALYNDWHRRRLAVKPGLSGPMQVNGRGDLSLDERVKLELEYIENYSIWRDISYLLKTVPAVLRGNGAR